jgi:flagellar motor switch protein FliG
LIAECLNDELPQAIAVALSQLPAQRASEVVAYLPAAQQAQVLERLVELDPARSWNFPEIREEFQHWLNQQIEGSLHRADLAARLATILDATHSGTRQRILHNVSASDARLAKELQHRLAVISAAAD